MGEMSLVGPRPIVDDEIVKYGSAFISYTRVRPGMTGLWQVSGETIFLHTNSAFTLIVLYLQLVNMARYFDLGEDVSSLSSDAKGLIDIPKIRKFSSG